MAKVSYVDLPEGYDDLYFKALQPGDRFQFSRVRVKNVFLSRKRVKSITRASLMVSEKPTWDGFSDAQRDAWTAAGVESKLTGWKQFLQDTDYRHEAGIPGYATPVTTHQALAGLIEIEEPSTGLLIEQPHPQTYYVEHKISGTRSQYEPREVDEPLTLPLTIGISWSTNLIAQSGDARARFYCRVYYSYQGLTLYEDVEIPFGLTDSWTRDTATLSAVKGGLQGYSAFIEAYDVRGELYFDNVSIVHGGENWARDPYCNSVQTAFTKAFAQIPRNWAAVNPNEGAGFRSVYPA